MDKKTKQFISSSSSAGGTALAASGLSASAIQADRQRKQKRPVTSSLKDSSASCPLFENQNVERATNFSKENTYLTEDKSLIKMGFVSDGSLLSDPVMQSLFYKHRLVWNFARGVVYIARKIETKDMASNDSSKPYYKAFEKERYSIILMDVDTFLNTFSNLKLHQAISSKKGLELESEWNSVNSKSPPGKRVEITFKYIMNTHSWPNRRGAPHVSRMTFHMSTWTHTRKSNLEKNPVCKTRDIMVRCLFYKFLSNVFFIVFIFLFCRFS